MRGSIGGHCESTVWGAAKGTEPGDTVETV